MLRRIVVALVVVALAGIWTGQKTAPASADAGGTPNPHAWHVCGIPAHGRAGCASLLALGASGVPEAGTSPPSGSYGPAQFHAGYNLPTAAPNAQTIAIVDAFTDPNIEADLGVYSTQFGLPACTQANGCLKIINSCVTTGTRKNPVTTCGSTVDPGWALEASLDVEVAHAMCQSCKILFVEAYSNSFSDLGAAVNVAVQNGATVVSNSYGAQEFSTESQYDSYWNHPGVATVFSSGDSGYQVLYPSSSPYVVSAGGTTLNLAAKTGTYKSESVWSGTGSGCSLYEPAPSWQTATPNWKSTLCGTARATADVSADADPNTGAAVYDSVPYYGTTGWYKVGGTSLAAPLIASTFALAGGVAGAANPASVTYTKFTATDWHDVTSGSNASCGTIMCTGVSGYDGPTGLGTPNGLGGF